MERQVQKANQLEFPGMMVPVEERASPQSMRGPFDAAAVPSAQDNEFAKTDYTTRFAHSLHRKNSTLEAEEEKKDKEQLRHQILAAGIKAFDDLTYEQIINNLQTTVDDYTKTMQKNLNAIRVDEGMIARGPDGKQFMTTEELESYQEKTGQCVNQIAIDQTTILNNHRVNTDAYFFVEAANGELAIRQSETQQLIEGLKNGTLKKEELSPEQRELVLAIENNGGAIPEHQSNALNALNFADQIGMSGKQLTNAGLMPLNVVTPNSVTYDVNTLSLLSKSGPSF